MEVTLEFITPDAEYQIGKYAAACYDAKTEREACVKRAKKVSEEGHLACLRFAHATFHISGISRVCSHQLVRSKHLDVLQQSQRYVNQLEAETVKPSNISQDVEVIFESVYEHAKHAYQLLIDKGVKKEDARFVLPEATHTSLYVVGNLQAWKDFIKLRADKHAQWEIRQVAKEINNTLSAKCPNLFYWMP